MAKQVEFRTSLADIIEIVEDNLDLQIDQFAQDMASEVKTLQAQGLSDKDILRRLVDDFKDKSGVFKNLESRLGGLVDFGIFQSSNLVSNQAVAESGDTFRWVVEPGAEHCSTCEERSGQIKTWQEWESVGLPGAFFRSGNIGTVCGHYCKCTLRAA